MTESRVEQDDLARLYDLDLAQDPGDLDLYLSLARRTDGPILELGVGSGRIAVPLAEAGNDVTGIDTDPAMLERARSRAAAVRVDSRLTLVEGDLRTVRLADAGAYRLALIALNSILLLPTRDDQRGALRTMADHLASGGLAVVDIWLPDADDLGRFDGRIVLEYARPDPGTGRIVTKAASAQHDAATQRVVLTAIYEESSAGQTVRRWVRTDHLRLVTADELVAMAEDSGLAIEQIAGGYDLAPLGAGSDRAILIAVKP
jgi:SAM-dependent methyltransferase